MRDANKLAELLKAHRIALGLTQRKLAQKIGVDPCHIAFIETGRRKPSLKLIARIADTLGVDRQELLVLAHPDAKALLAKPPFKPSRKATPSWPSSSKITHF